MLDKEICKQCKMTLGDPAHIQERTYALSVPSGIPTIPTDPMAVLSNAQWSEFDEAQWEDCGVVYCPKRNMAQSIHMWPPSDCPYRLENIMYDEENINENGDATTKNTT